MPRTTPKGTQTRADLLAAAEALFCEKGFDAVSVADLTGAVGMSKAGFYHHFTGKDAVLAELCEEHAHRAVQSLEAVWPVCQDGLGRINAILTAFMPIRLEERAYLRMLMPHLRKAEARCLALSFQDALTADFLPWLVKAVAQAKAERTIHPECTEMERAVLHLVNQCWMELLSNIRDESAALSTLQMYRRAVEVLLNAPFGSIHLVDLSAVAALIAD